MYCSELHLSASKLTNKYAHESWCDFVMQNTYYHILYYFFGALFSLNIVIFHFSFLSKEVVSNL